MHNHSYRLDRMEFLYTRQQMEGFKGYQSKVKIGNWSEDMELEAAKLKNYLMKKERGQLKCSQVGSHTHALQYLLYCPFFFFFPSFCPLPLLAAPSPRES